MILVELAAGLGEMHESDPEELANLLSPYMVEMLRSSALRSSHNALVDTLEEKPAEALSGEELQAWGTNRTYRAIVHIKAMGSWLNEQQRAALRVMAKAKESTPAFAR